MEVKVVATVLEHSDVVTCKKHKSLDARKCNNWYTSSASMLS